MNMSVVLVLGLFTFIWGLWVINPFWTVFTQATLYADMREYGGELFWGSFALFTGALTIYGAIRMQPPYVYYGSAASGWHWFVVGIFYLLGDWQNTGGITAWFISILSLCVYLNIKINYEHGDLPEPLDD